MDAVRTCRDGGIGRLEPRPLGQNAAIRGAVAIPFVLLSIWADQKPAATYQAERRSFVILTLVAGAGLIAWEFIQQSSRSLFFDYHDIAATIFGLFAAWLLFVLLTSRADELALRPTSAKWIRSLVLTCWMRITPGQSTRIAPALDLPNWPQIAVPH